MRIRQTLLVLGAFASLCLGASAASAAQMQLMAVLNGGFETPPHSTKYVGSAVVQWVSASEICYAVLVDNIAKPTAMHIHQGAPGVAGPIVVPLTAPSSGNPGSVSGCLSGLDAALVKDLFVNPVRYYVNVHNTPFSAGALRGQLMSITLGIPDPE
jgi:hypothetical protein